MNKAFNRNFEKLRSRSQNLFFFWNSYNRKWTMVLPVWIRIQRKKPSKYIKRWKWPLESKSRICEGTTIQWSLRHLIVSLPEFCFLGRHFEKFSPNVSRKNICERFTRDLFPIVITSHWTLLSHLDKVVFIKQESFCSNFSRKSLRIHLKVGTASL